MDKTLQALPGLVKAVTDPFSLLALITVGSGLVAYLAIRKSESVTAAGLPGPKLALSIVAISFLALSFNVIRVSLPKAPPPVTPPEQISLRVAFKEIVMHTVAVTVPFSVRSGQLNVGCGDSASTSVSWTLPPGAREVNESASWQRADGLKNNAQSVVVQGSVVIATGSISGQDRQWTGNCPGGGHGELVLTGSYVIDQPASSEAISLPAFQGQVSPGAQTDVDLPGTAWISDLSVEIVAASTKTDQSTSTYKISLTPSLSLTRINHQGSKTIDASIAGNKLLVKVT